jgi:hypothetical protein
MNICHISTRASQKVMLSWHLYGFWLLIVPLAIGQNHSLDLTREVERSMSANDKCNTSET